MIDQKKAKSEKAVLIGIITQQQDETKSEEYLDELAFLAETAGAETIKRFTQKLTNPHPKTFVGTGKLDEIINYVKQEEVEMIIFDDGGISSMAMIPVLLNDNFLAQ